MLVFCHEYPERSLELRPYADHLRDLGFDLFTFDFRNHGASESHPVYRPLQWVTDHEVRDLQAALAYLRSRPDHDPAGFGLFGVSRGGGTALSPPARTDVWGVITDGAFPTRGTMLAYILRWARDLCREQRLYRILRDRPLASSSSWAGSAGVARSSRLHCRFPSVERASPGLAPRPWLMIHGGKDAYIGPDIARGLFDRAGDPKELWVVPGAKHNRCREIDPWPTPRIAEFLRRSPPVPRTPRRSRPMPMPRGRSPGPFRGRDGLRGGERPRTAGTGRGAAVLGPRPDPHARRISWWPPCPADPPAT